MPPSNDRDTAADIYSMVSELQQAGRICDAMRVGYFLESDEEVMRDSSADIIASILEQYQPPRDNTRSKQTTAKCRG
jgi:hypothetical protein